MLNAGNSKQDPCGPVLNWCVCVLNLGRTVCICPNCRLNFGDHDLNRALFVL